MGTSVPEKNLGEYAKLIGFVSLLLLGLGILLGVFSYFIEFGYVAPDLSGAPAGFWGFFGLGIVVAVLILVLSALVMMSGMKARSGVFSSRTLLTALLIAALAFLLNGVGLFSLYSTCGSNCSYYGYGPILDGGIVSLIAGIVLIITSAIFRGVSLSTRIMASIFGLAFGILVTSQVYYVGASGLFSYLISSSSTSYGALFQDISALFNPLGILDWSYLTGVAFILAAVGFMLYSIIVNSKAVAISFIIVLVGALIFAVGVVWSSLSQLTASGFWSFVTSTPIQGVMPAIAEVVLVIAGFLLIAATALGIAVQGQGLARLVTAVPTAGQPSAASVSGQMAAGFQFCPACGAQNPSDSAFCKKCGTKLG